VIKSRITLTGQGFLQSLRFSPVIIIPPMLHTHILFIYHRVCIILAIDIVDKEAPVKWLPSSGIWRHICSHKLWHISTRLHGVTSRKQYC